MSVSGSRTARQRPDGSARPDARPTALEANVSSSLRPHRVRLVALGSALVAAVAAVVFAGPARAATLTEVTGFGSNPGNLKMFEYIPTGLAANRPLVVLLHGCSATAAQIDNESGWTKWADQFQFALVLPQQKRMNNAALCFNVS